MRAGVRNTRIVPWLSHGARPLEVLPRRNDLDTLVGAERERTKGGCGTLG